MTQPTKAAELPDALRLADALECRTTSWPDKVFAAAELRRLHAENVRLAALVEAQQPAPSAAVAEIEGGPPGSGGWEKHAIEMERQRDYYRQRCHTMEEHQNGGVWYWQGDDGDSLESMGNSMLVVIRADQLRSLMHPSPTPQADSQPAPINMVLHCPKCGLQHIDAPDERTPGWKNELHRSHLCHGCGHIWRPADVPTNGVKAVKTTGKADSPIAARAPADSVTAPAGGVEPLAAIDAERAALAQKEGR